MGVNIQTIREIRTFINNELNHLFTKEELTTLTSIIIRTVSGHTKLFQFQEPELKLSKNEIERIIEITDELKTEKPLQYILGETTFYNCRILLNNSTLIPRPETEELTDLIIRENRGSEGKISDFCTGSGCIAIALAKNIPGASVTGTDISAEAIEMAEKNAVLNNTIVNFITHDIFNQDNVLNDKYSIIVSNPPYVKESEKKFMKKNVLAYEPNLALFVPDNDPLVFYRRIMQLSEQMLLPGGKVYFEINEALGNECARMLTDSKYTKVSIIKDLNGKDRIVKGEKHE